MEDGASSRQEIKFEHDGQVISVDFSIEPLIDNLGEVTGLTLVALETTDVRRMEAEAMRSQTHIEVQRRLIAERELERTRIARELHDGPLQDLIATNFNLVDAMGIRRERCAPGQDARDPGYAAKADPGPAPLLQRSAPAGAGPLWIGKDHPLACRRPAGALSRI